MKIHRGVAVGAIVGAVAVGIGTIAAFAAVPIPGADGKIRACVKYEDINRYEQMRWITKTTCPAHEKLITWNAKGPKGDKGDKGDSVTGPPGPAGMSGYEVVNTPTATVPAGKNGVAEAACPTGKKAVGGGFLADPEATDWNFIASFPSTDGSSWHIGVTNKGSNDAEIRPYAVCVIVQ
jgi:hypothetical protein